MRLHYPSLSEIMRMPEGYNKSNNLAKQRRNSMSYFKREYNITPLDNCRYRFIAGFSLMKGLRQHPEEASRRIL